MTDHGPMTDAELAQFHTMLIQYLVHHASELTAHPTKYLMSHVRRLMGRRKVGFRGH